MDYQDYYAILGVPKTATENEIRSAYRKLARQYHPDVNPDNEEAVERFKQINEAYEVLSDPEKRKVYDQVGSRWREYEQWQRSAAQSGEQVDWQDLFGQPPGGYRYEYRTVNPEDLEDLFGDTDPFSDFFSNLFGGGVRGGGRGGRRRTGGDLESPISATLAEAYKGSSRVITIQTPDGQSRQIEVQIPPGVRDGSRIRVSGQGMPGQSGGQAGDLYLVVTVQPDPRFEREGNDLHTAVRVPVSVLLLGGEVPVPTPDNRTLHLTIPPGTQDGRTFRLRGRGMPELRQPDRRGDLFVEVHARLPERLTPRQRELIEEFASLEAENLAGVS